MSSETREQDRLISNKSDEFNHLELRLESFSYGRIQILGEINLTVGKEETIALVGQSGIGKTTLLRILAGLELDFIGKCRVPDRVGMVFQEPTLLPWRNVLENLYIASEVNNEQAAKILDEVGLTGKEKHFPGQLSLGQQRRLALARAFAIEPEVLLMDEPFVSLDAEMAKEMMDLLVNLQKNRSISTVLVTHSNEEANTLASRTLELGGSPARIVGEKTTST